MKDLPFNYSRCCGSKCNEKADCARFTSPPGTSITDFSVMVKSVARCNMFEDNERG